jgi:integrase
VVIPKRAARGSVVDLWHRPARDGELVYYPADQSDGPVWCMDRTHFRKSGTMVCTTRHGQGKRWRAAWVDLDSQQRAKAFDNKVDAQAHIDGVTTQLGTGTYADPQRSGVTFGTVAETWHNGKEAANRAPKTVAGYRGLLDVVILPKWEGYRLRDIDHEALQTWFSWLSTNPAARKYVKRDKDGNAMNIGLSPARVIQIHQVVHQVFDYAIRTKYVVVNPADRIELPSKPDGKKLALTHEQVTRLAEAIVKAEAAVRHRAGTAPALTSPDGLATMVRLLGYAGLRYSECAALRVGDVDIDHRRIMVDKSVTQVRGKGHVERNTTKNHLKVTVPILTTELADALARVVEGRAPAEYLFPGPDGGSMSEGWFGTRFDKAVEALGVPGVTPNTLRHTAGSLTISETPTATGVLLAQKLLRHRNLTTTANVYSHLIDGDWDKLAAAMDRATQSGR